MRRGRDGDDGTVWQFTTSIHRCHQVYAFFFCCASSASRIASFVEHLSAEQSHRFSNRSTTTNKRIHGGCHIMSHFAHAIRLYIFHWTILILNSLCGRHITRHSYTEHWRYTLYTYNKFSLQPRTDSTSILLFVKRQLPYELWNDCERIQKRYMCLCSTAEILFVVSQWIAFILLPIL